MRLSRFTIIGLNCLLATALCAAGAMADPSIIASGTTSGLGATASSTLATGVSYDELRRRLHPMRLDSAAAARAAVATLDDRAIELRGQICGVMSTPKGRNYLLQMDDATLLLAAPLSLDNGALNPGASVRVLATTAESPEAKACNADLTILAASRNPVPSIVLSPAPANDGGVTVAPPMTDMVLGAPGATLTGQGNSVTQGTPAIVPSAPDDEIEPQKASYRELVRHFNKRLNEQQLDAIAGALLGAAGANQIDPRFLTSIIAVESSFDIYCLSSSGAMGLGQLMPFNVKEAGISNAWDPVQNIYGTARLLHASLESYRGRPNSTLLAVAAYNAGSGAVRRAGYQVPSGEQVQRYVWKVYYQYKALAPDMFNK